ARGRSSPASTPTPSPRAAAAGSAAAPPRCWCRPPCSTRRRTPAGSRRRSAHVPSLSFPLTHPLEGHRLVLRPHALLGRPGRAPLGARLRQRADPERPAPLLLGA